MATITLNEPAFEALCNGVECACGKRMSIDDAAVIGDQWLCEDCEEKDVREGLINGAECACGKRVSIVDAALIGDRWCCAECEEKEYKGH